MSKSKKQNQPSFEDITLEDLQQSEQMLQQSLQQFFPQFQAQLIWDEEMSEDIHIECL